MTIEHNICVLGGAGFVGQHLVKRLIQDGHRVKIITRRRNQPNPLSALTEVETVAADVHDEAVLCEQFNNVNVVINLIAILNEQHKGEFQRVHVELPRKIISACRNNNISRLLHMSALHADAQHGPSLYLRTKGEGEQLVLNTTDLTTTTFRPSIIFGPEDHFFNRFAGLLKLAPYFFPLACPDSKFAPVYVKDVTAAFAKAIDNKSTYGQGYDLCGPQVYTLKKLVEYTAEQKNLSRKIIGLNRTLSGLQAAIMEHVPGKPFTRDNFQSLQIDSVCQGTFPAVFDIEPTALESVVPAYLAANRK